MPPTRFAFGDFLLDTTRFELSRLGDRVRVERKPLELLILLAEHTGELVTRSQIAERLWGRDVFVDTEHGINTAIRKIRQVLRDDTDQPRFLQTVPGKGYRFVGVSRVDGGHDLTRTVGAVNEFPPSPITGEQPIQAETTASRPEAGKRFHRRAGIVVCLGCGVLVCVAFVLNSFGLRAKDSRVNSLAVLPLNNVSREPGQDYLADGVTDEMITMLAKNSTLRIVSRTSATQFRAARQPLPEVARELGVDAIVEGSISRNGNRVHLTLQLVDGATDTHLWAESYDRDVNDLVSLPRDAAQAVAQRLHHALPPAQVKPINPEAHDAYLHGNYLWYAGNEQAGDYFRKAIQLQPDYAKAWDGISEFYLQDVIGGTRSPTVWNPAAEQAAQRALELEPTLPMAHLMMCAVHFVVHWDWSRAEDECKRATELDTRYGEAYHFRSKVLAVLNRTTEAIELQKLAMDLDPFSRPYGMAHCYDMARQWDAAIDDANQRLVSDPHDAGLHFLLSDAYSAKGMTNDAEEAFESGLSDLGLPKEVSRHHEAFKRGGYRAGLELNLEWQLGEAKKGYYSSEMIAATYAELRDRERALTYLETALREHDGPLLWMQSDWRFDFLHAEPRYRAVVEGVGLPPAY